MDTYTNEQDRWIALLERRPQADGAFVYAVTTTGVCCRPVCRSRRPRRENVQFFDSFHQAERAGFRPCKRCRPDLPAGSEAGMDPVLHACRLIETAEKPPSLSQLAGAVSLSPSYLHRLFKKALGITPKQYAVARRSQQVREHLRTSPTVTDAVYEAGFAASSRFYAQASTTLGMAPATYRAGGPGARIRFAIARCSLGWVLAAATEKGLCAIEFGDTPQELEARLRAVFPHAERVDEDPEFAAWMQQVLVFLDTPRAGLDLPLDIQGTAFQQRVWSALRQIPPGATATYAQIAARIGSPQSARAVAQACATNPIAVAIPCHRIVRSDGSLGGYRWGTERKQKLLAREAGEH